MLGLVAAIIVSHAFAPPAVGAVTSIVSTIIGALFVNLRDPKKKSGASEEGGQP